MSRHPDPSPSADVNENGTEDHDSSSKGREPVRLTSRRRSSTGSPKMGSTDSSISLYKTEHCQSYSETGYCRYGAKCRFAHGQADIRPLARHKKYKTELCKTYAKDGYCPYGARCRFVHDESERETSRTASPSLQGRSESPFVAPAGSPAMSPFIAPVSASPQILSTSPNPQPARRDSAVLENHASLLSSGGSREPPPGLAPPASPAVLPPPAHLPHPGGLSNPPRRSASPALTPIGTPVNKPTTLDMRPFDAFASLSLSGLQDDPPRSSFRPATHTLKILDNTSDHSSSLFSEPGGGIVPLGPRSLSVPADHRASSGVSSHVGGLRGMPPLRPPELTRNVSLSVGHHPLDPPAVDPPSLAIPSSILDSMTTSKPGPLNTSLGDSKDDLFRPTPRGVANRSRSFDTSDNYRYSHEQEEELASCSSILSHLELHNDSQPLSPSTVEPPPSQDSLFTALPPLYPKRQSFCYDDINMLPTSGKLEPLVVEPRPKTPDITLTSIKPTNTIISTPPKTSPLYKPHGSPKTMHSPLKSAQTPPPHGRTARARVSASSSPHQTQPRSPLIIHALHDSQAQQGGQLEILGRSKTDPRQPKKDPVRLSAFAAPFSSTPGSPGSAPSYRLNPARSLFPSTNTTPTTTTVRPPRSPVVMHLSGPPDDFGPLPPDDELESPVLSLLNETDPSTTSPSSASVTASTSPVPGTRTSPALSPFPPPFFPKSSTKTIYSSKGSLRKSE